MRKTKTVTVEFEGRDKGKTFLIREMSARQAERWADRAFLALAHSAIDLPPGMVRAGMAGIAEIAALLGHVQFSELAPLMDELLACVRVVPSPDRRGPDGSPFVRDLVDRGEEGDDVEEVRTRQWLRSEVLGLHVNFSLAAVALMLLAAASEMTEVPEISTSTPTSRRRSARRSPAASPALPN